MKFRVSFVYCRMSHTVCIITYKRKKTSLWWNRIVRPVLQITCEEERILPTFLMVLLADNGSYQLEEVNSLLSLLNDCADM